MKQLSSTSESSSQPALNVALFGEVLADVFPDRSVLGGAPFNVARHLRAFGLAPRLISRTGADALRHALLKEMARLDMDSSGIQLDDAHPTGQVRVVLENDGHRFDILPDQAYDHISAHASIEALHGFAPRLAYFGSLAQRSPASRGAIEQFLSSCDCPLFLDINLRSPWYDQATIDRSLQAADMVKLNEDELTEVASLLDLSEATPTAQALALQQQFGLRQILVTCGAEGSWLLDQQQKILTAAPTKAPVTLVDTVGAGDAFSAVFMLGTLLDWALPTTLQRAGDYAAALCGIRGAAPPSTDFVEPFRQAWGMANC